MTFSIFSSLFKKTKAESPKIKATATFDSIWTSGFSLGFSKAWEIMIPLMEDGFKRKEKYFFNEAVNTAVKNLEPAVQTRVNALGDKKMIAVNDLIAKRKHFENQLSSLKGAEKERASNYIEALNWALNGNGIQKN